MRTRNRTWAHREFSQAQLGDARRTKRLIGLAEQRGARPQASIPQACGDLATTKACYRFYSNEEISAQEILNSHLQATQERLLEESLVLAIQDTTQLDYSNHPATRGLGMLSDPWHQGLLVHTTLAVTPRRVPLGLLSQEVWTRSVEEVGKRHQRKHRDLSVKESRKWLNGLEATAPLSHSRLIHVGDREADIYDFFKQALEERQEVLVRAAWNRRVAHPQKHLWAYLESQPQAGTLIVTVPRKSGQPARKTRLALRWSQVLLKPPKHRAEEGLKPLTVWAILVQEVAPPKQRNAIGWLLLTTVEVATFEAACQRVEWYACRWVIELYHKVLKSGCRIEDRQFETADRLQRYLALDSVVAWRVLFLTMLGRELSNVPCTALLEAREWQALYGFIHQTNLFPNKPPSLQQAARWIGQLGGFLGRKSDGHPGATVIWRGLQRLNDITLAWQIFRSPPPFPKNVGKD